MGRSTAVLSILLACYLQCVASGPLRVRARRLQDSPTSTRTGTATGSSSASAYTRTATSTSTASVTSSRSSLASGTSTSTATLTGTSTASTSISPSPSASSSYATHTVSVSGSPSPTASGISCPRGYSCNITQDGYAKYPCDAGNFGSLFFYPNQTCGGLCDAGSLCLQGLVGGSLQGAVRRNYTVECGPGTSMSELRDACGLTIPCPAGLVCTGTGFAPTPVGNISLPLGADLCPAGFFCPLGTMTLDTAAHNGPKLCAPGYQCSNGSITSTGVTYTFFDRSNFSISTGTFGNTTTNASWGDPCFPGFKSQTAKKLGDPWQCTPCLQNKYNPIYASDQCLNCPAGTEFPPSVNAPDGTLTSGAALQLNCTPCPVKYFSKGIGVSCEQCPAGQITSGPGQADCFPLNPVCDAGKTAKAPLLGASLNPQIDCVPFDCPLFMQLSTDRKACLGCPAGKYGSKPSDACADCDSQLFSCPGNLPFPLLRDPSQLINSSFINTAICISGATLESTQSFASTVLPADDLLSLVVALPLSVALFVLAWLARGVDWEFQCGKKLGQPKKMCFRECLKRIHLTMNQQSFVTSLPPGGGQPAGQANISVLAQKQSPFGGVVVLALIHLLVGLWLWQLLTFFNANVVQTQSAVNYAEADLISMLSMPWAAPSSRIPNADKIPLLKLPQNVNLQLRLYGQADLKCGAPIPLDYFGDTIFLQDQWTNNTKWLLQPQYTAPQPLNWRYDSFPFCGTIPSSEPSASASFSPTPTISSSSSSNASASPPPSATSALASPSSAPQAPTNVSLLTVSCVDCVLAPDSYITFAMPFTCQSFYLELVYVTALGEVGAVALDPRYTVATLPLVTTQLLASVTWTLSPSLSKLVDTTRERAAGLEGPTYSARGYSVSSVSAVTTRVNISTAMRGGGVQPFENAVVINVRLPRQPTMEKIEVSNNLTALALIAAMGSLVSLSMAACTGFFTCSTKCRGLKCAPGCCSRKKSPFSPGPSPPNPVRYHSPPPYCIPASECPHPLTPFHPILP